MNEVSVKPFVCSSMGESQSHVRIQSKVPAFASTKVWLTSMSPCPMDISEENRLMSRRYLLRPFVCSSMGECRSHVRIQSNVPTFASAKVWFTSMSPCPMNISEENRLMSRYLLRPFVCSSMGECQSHVRIKINVTAFARAKVWLTSMPPCPMNICEENRLMSRYLLLWNARHPWIIFDLV